MHHRPLFAMPWPRRAYIAVRPPSITTSLPVTKDASSDARYTTA